MSSIAFIGPDLPHTLLALQDKLSVLKHLTCFDNAWSYSEHVEGNYGWVHTDGTIGMDRDIILANPIQTIHEELCLLAKHFRFLEMHVTLFDQSCKQEEGQVILSWVVKGGVCQVSTKSVLNLHGRERHRQELSVNTVLSVLCNPVMPCAYEDTFLVNIAKHIRKMWDKLE